MKRFQILGRSLSKIEQRLISGGTGFDGCITHGGDECSLNGSGNPEDQCCEGLSCMMNSCGTGTLCLKPGDEAEAC